MKKGSPINEIYSNKTPWEFETLPVIISNFHAILYELQPNLKTAPEAHKTKVNCHWNEGYVRMPYSPKNLFPSVDENGIATVISRWDLIQKTLLQDICSSRAFEAALNAYNSRLPKFRALHYLFEEVFDEERGKYFFEKLLPKIINLALKLPEIVPGSIPLLKADHCKSISLSQQQISCLLANAFLCTFSGKKSVSQDYPSVNFVGLFSASSGDSVIEKLKCVIHYFKRVLDSVPVGVVTFERQHISRSNLPKWDKLENNLGNTKIHITSEGTIEDDGLGMLQVDFANKFLGGGVLGHGCVQEEIRFVICPELIVSRLFTEKLGHNESLIITGAERFSKYTGYGDSFTWSGDFIDQTPHDKYGRRKTSIVAIDATSFSKRSDQFNCSLIFRELNKAYAGFYSRATGSLIPVATGNWGCGAFGGDVYLKFLIQLMACNAARRNLVYFTFGSEVLTEEFYNMYMFLATNHVTIGQLWRLISRCASTELKANELFPFIQQAYFDSKKSPHQEESNSSNSSGSSSRECFSGSSNKIMDEDSNVRASTSVTMMDTQEESVQSGFQSNVSNLECGDSECEKKCEKRKRSSSERETATDVCSLISRIDGSSGTLKDLNSGSTTTKSSSSSSSIGGSSFGFLNCIDEYSLQQKNLTAKSKLVDGQVYQQQQQQQENEQIAVEKLLEELQNASRTNSNTSSKKKITDYFKKR